jgi:regulator of sirC expression with transglutaminase-like and TPR domain
MTHEAALAELLAEDEPPLATCLFLLSAALTERDDVTMVGEELLDRYAAGLDDATAPSLIHHLFDTLVFRGDVDDYQSAENSFLDRVLERRTGMPITLSAVVAEVGARVGLGMHLVGMPGHVLVGLDDDPTRFIDAFAGTELDEQGVQLRFASIFGKDAALPPHALQPIDTAAVINRVCNNLTRTWVERDPAAINRLLEVRAALPGTTRDKQLIIGLAEARGRLDIAARLRTEIDPTDPTIDRLWARLN